MPGPVSDSYDPEFGTAANVQSIETEIHAVIGMMSYGLGKAGLPVDLKPILDVVRDESYTRICLPIVINERTARVIRFGLNRALESL